MPSTLEKAQTTLSQNLGGVAQKIAPKGAKFSLDDVPDQSGKVAVITGGSEGIGYGCTWTLLSKDISKIFILSVSEEVAKNCKQSIQEDMDEDMVNRTIWIPCELSNWTQVTEAASKIREQTDRLDILINNGARGIMTYQLTDYGVDRHMAVNHIGHVILTSHLLPLLKKTAEQGHTVRISNQASNAHEQTPGDTKFASLDEMNRDLGPMGQYGRSKLAGILYSRYLARHLTSSYPKILVNATHPGVVETKMSKQDIHEPYPKLGYLMSEGMAPFKKDQFEGCVSTMYATTTTEKSGEYICPPADPESGSDLAQDEELGEQLMKLTREIVREKAGEESVDKGCPLKDY
jgi:NAD(P)-dependent dehydrogenase (short-subunit alcohol dehydrogenase family)